MFIVEIGEHLVVRSEDLETYIINTIRINGLDAIRVSG